MKIIDLNLEPALKIILNDNNIHEIHQLIELTPVEVLKTPGITQSDVTCIITELRKHNFDLSDKKQGYKLDVAKLPTDLQPCPIDIPSPKDNLNDYTLWWERIKDGKTVKQQLNEYPIAKTRIARKFPLLKSTVINVSNHILNNDEAKAPLLTVTPQSQLSERTKNIIKWCIAVRLKLIGMDVVRNKYSK